MKESVPRIIKKTRWEELQEAFRGIFEIEGSVGFELWQLFRNIFYWVIENALWLGILVLLASLIWFLWIGIQEKRSEIQRLWVFLLFFLSKRHMVLPLLHFEAKAHHWLDETTLEKMVTLRQMARQTSLRQNPVERMKIEEETSALLVRVFAKLEQSENAAHNTIIQTVGADLEFVDEKLIALQKEYNSQVLAFNKKYFDGIAGQIFRLTPLARLPLFGQA